MISSVLATVFASGLPLLNPFVSFDITRVLVHFAWQGTAVAVVLMALNAVMVKASANARYLVGLVALAVLVLCPLVTYGLLPDSSDFHGVGAVLNFEIDNVENGIDRDNPVAAQDQVVPFTMESVREDDSAPKTMRILQLAWLRTVSPYVAFTYTVGVFAMLIRLAIAYWTVNRLRSVSTQISEGPVCQIVYRLCEKWTTSVVPMVAFCQRVTVPVITGVIRPMILVPPSLMSGLNVQQLEVLLAHEIAHIRRWDLVVNLAQRIVESFLFLHPAVWYISHRISIERENACDDLVIASGWQSTDYVSAILGMAELCTGEQNHSLLSASSLAASGNRPSQLKQRVLRILGESPNHSNRLGNFGVLFPVLFLLGLVSMGVMLTRQRETLSQNSSGNQPPILYSIETGQSDLAAKSSATSDASEWKPQSPSEERLVFVFIEGNSTIPTSEIAKHIRTCEGQPFTQKQIKDDVDSLVRTRWFATVEPILRQTEEGLVLTYRVQERPIIRRVEYKGLKNVKQSVFDGLTQLKAGSPFDIAANRECVRRIEEYYHEKGYMFATVVLEKGEDREDREIVFLIYEGPKVTLLKANGNTGFNTRTLNTLTKTVIGHESDSGTINDNIEGMKWYYHRLGYFDVEIVPEKKQLSDESRAEIHYHIDEGIRYKIRDIEIAGNQILSEEEIRGMMKVQGGVFFNARDINADIEKIRTKYGEQGRFFSRVDAVPRFTEEEGIVDIQYRIDEDRVYRISSVYVHIPDDQEHTTANLVKNVDTLARGDLADPQKIRSFKERLHGASDSTRNGDRATIEGSEQHETAALRKVKYTLRPKVTEQSLSNYKLIYFRHDRSQLCQNTDLLIKKIDIYPVEVIDVEKDWEKSREYGVDSVPCTVITRDGKETIRYSWFEGEKHLTELATASENGRQVVTYCIGDLLFPMPSGLPDEKFSMPYKATMANWLTLIDTITSTVEPKCWKTNGGECVIKTYETTQSLVIRAPQRIHQQVTELLAQMRKKIDVQVCTEICWVQHADRDILKKSGCSFRFDPTSKCVHLTIEEAKKFKAQMQARMQTQLLQAPKLTTFDNQVAQITYPREGEANNENDLRLFFRPKVVADPKRIRFNFAMNPQDLVSELIESVEFIEDGQYVLFDVNERLKIKGREMISPNQTYLLVCPRIIVMEEVIENAIAR